MKKPWVIEAAIADHKAVRAPVREDEPLDSVVIGTLGGGVDRVTCARGETQPMETLAADGYGDGYESLRELAENHLNADGGRKRVGARQAASLSRLLSEVASLREEKTFLRASLRSIRDTNARLTAELTRATPPKADP